MMYLTSSSPFALRLLASFASLLLHHCMSAVVLSYFFVLAAADASVSPAAVAAASLVVLSSVFSLLSQLIVCFNVVDTSLGLPKYSFLICI